MKKRGILTLVVIILIIVVIIFIRPLFGNDKELEFRTYVVDNYTVENNVTATGTIQPLEQVEVGTQVSGEIDKIYVDYNSVVKKGQLLAELDKSNLLENLSQAEATVTSAESELNYAQSSFERTEELYNNNAATRIAYDEAKNSLVKAQTSLQNAKSNYDKSKVNLGYAEIYSPIDGVVLSREVEVGQTVAASYSTPTLFTIANDLTQMKVEADVDEADIGQVKEGQKVKFTVDAYIDDVFYGEVQQIRLQPTTTNNVVTYTVIITAHNPELKLLPGMTASVTIVTKSETGLVVPSEALNFMPSPQIMAEMNVLSQPEARPAPSDAMTPKEKVWVKRDGSLQMRHIVTDMSDGVYRIVKQGLGVGDTVVLSATYIERQKDENRSSSNPFMPGPPGRPRNENNSNNNGRNTPKAN